MNAFYIFAHFPAQNYCKSVSSLCIQLLHISSSSHVTEILNGGLDL